MPAQEGQSYGPYRVIRTLGSGGMGTVLLAEDSRLGRYVALKTFRRDPNDPADARDRVLREARAVAGLSHPNIASVHDVLDVGGEMVIVFEYVEGETLAARMARGRLPVVEAIRIAAEVADGLAAAHARGIIHRDLKPGNIMLTRDGRAKILDFGIARNASASQVGTTLTTTSGVFAGTPAYAAPEQWVGDPVTPRTDLFAFGILLFETLGGRRPFDAESRLAMMQLVLDAPRPNLREVNPQVPASVAALVETLLARDPNLRPASATEVASVLRSVERDLPATQHAFVPARTGRRPLAVAAVIVLIAAVAALVAPLRRPDATPSAAVTPVVAVLPLANATGTPANDYIATGVADSLTTSLASMNGVVVISRAAVATAAARESEPARVASELGATYLVEGGVQLSGDRVKLTVNLVRPDRSVVWADSVEGLFDDIFSLQSRLAAALGRALSVQLSAAERAKLAQQPTANPDALAAYYRGRALLERRDVRGNTDAALAAFDEAVRLDPNFAVAHAARGEALWARYVETREPEAPAQAIEAGTTALRLDPNRASVRYTLAVSLAGSGRLDDAVDELQRALALQPTYDDARRELGNVLARKGKLDEAIAEYRRAIALRPDYWGHYSALGFSLLQAARYDEAAEAYRRVIQLQPDSATGYQQLGTVYQAMGRNAEAVANYERSISIQPSAQAYSNLGASHHARGDYRKAIDAYRAAIKIRPNSPATHRNLGDALRRLGLQSDAREAYADAARLAEAALEVNPRDPLTLSSLALYLAKRGDAHAADKRLDEALRLSPDDVQILYRAAAIHALAHRPSQAIAALTAAVRRGYNRRAAAEDDDFSSLRQHPEFVQLVESPK
jgi:tetratricopeptide (TPR) repeat protein/negative regulator of sigma E activity